uniref:Uncharacterized protein n=1 Tax=Sphaerodactylus townsendi TaxID=933632 RepID=A0ACB8FVR5_9SAUR
MPALFLPGCANLAKRDAGWNLSFTFRFFLLSPQPPFQNKDDGPPEAKQTRGGTEEGETVKHNELKLRNYTPEDEELKSRVVPQAKAVSDHEDSDDKVLSWQNFAQHHG